MNFFDDFDGDLNLDWFVFGVGLGLGDELAYERRLAEKLKREKDDDDDDYLILDFGD